MDERLEFGPIEIRPAERALRVDGRPVSLGARAFDLLLVLVQRRDRVVGKKELLDAVWPGLVVEENNLAVHVSALRKALGARTIATIPGRGYRFVAPGEPERRRPEPPVPEPAVQPALVGRDDDLAALAALWPRARCVTVVGAGGIGKTTLARAAAHARRAQLRDGAVWVDLAESASGARVPAAIAQALQVDTVDAADPLTVLLDALASMQLLLVLDNAEQVLEPVARIVHAILAGAPGVQVLVTSQAPLRVDGEQVFRLAPLAVPEDGADVPQALAHGAVELFAAQARAADRRFEVTADNVATVIALCRHLDGVPLALKLAAARLPLLGLTGLVGRLGDRLRVLRGNGRDAPARQQTLLAALDWSHALLPAPLQAVFRRLAVFAGGFPLDLVGRVAVDAAADDGDPIDGLAELVDRSLVEVDGGDPPRYRLAETVREYARLRLLGAGEVESTQRRHAEAMAAALEQAYDRYWAVADRPWLAQYAPELDNVRAALDWAAGHDPRLALRLVGCAGMLFMLLGQAPEARRRFAALEAAASDAGIDAASARYWLERSRLQWGVDNAAMHAFGTRSVGHYRALGDARGVALALRCVIGSEASSAADAAAALAEMSALVRPDAPPRLRAQRLLAETITLRQAGRVADACAASEALLRLTTEAGLDGMASAALAGLVSACLAAGDAEAAIAGARRLLADPSARRGSFLLHPLGMMAEAHLQQGRTDLARQVLVDFAAASRSREWEWFGVYAGVFAWLAACEGRVEDAARLLGHAERAASKVEIGRGAPNAARARARALIARRLSPAAFERLVAEGARLDEPAVCALGLAGPAQGNDPIMPTDSSAPRRRAVTSSRRDDRKEL